MMTSSADDIPGLLERVREVVVDLDPQVLAKLEQSFAGLAEIMAGVGVSRPTERDLHMMVAAYLMYRSLLLRNAEDINGQLGRSLVGPIADLAGQHLLLMLGATPRPFPRDDLPPGPADPTDHDPTKE